MSNQALTGTVATTISIGDRAVHRVGFGAMRLFGESGDRENALEVLRRAVELGVEFIDTSDSYGPGVAEALIREALQPYGDSLLIATKVAGGDAAQLKSAAEESLRRLGVDSIGLLQLQGIAPNVPLADQLGALSELKSAGKVQEIGVSDIDLEGFTEAVKLAPLASVQQRYNVTDRRFEEILNACDENGVAFIACAPLDDGQLTSPGGRPIDRPIDNIGWRVEALPSQLSLGWLLRHSPSLLPIPGTSSVDHLEENMGASKVSLGIDDYNIMASLVKPGSAA